MSEVQQIGNIVDDTNIGFKNPQRGRIYSADGVSPALKTKQGGGLEPKIVCHPDRTGDDNLATKLVCACLTPDRMADGSKTMKNRCSHLQVKIFME